MRKILVSYFSASGVTKEVAKKVATAVSGDLFEIEPKDKYTNEDLDWTNKNSRSYIEMNDSSSRPEIKNRIFNIDEYDTVFVGFPIWWDLAPTIINTFIEENNLENKSIYVFATSGGSSEINSFNILKSTYKNLNFISSKKLSSNVSESDIITWTNM